jgi:hypothetical protein
MFVSADGGEWKPVLPPRQKSPTPSGTGEKWREFQLAADGKFFPIALITSRERLRARVKELESDYAEVVAEFQRFKRETRDLCNTTLDGLTKLKNL